MTKREAIEKAVLGVSDISHNTSNNSRPYAVKRGNEATLTQRRNAIKKYAHGIEESDIVVMMDTSVFNSFKSGMLLTESGFYSTDFYSGAFGIGKIPLPVVLDELERVQVSANTSRVILFYRNGTTAEVYSGIYTYYVAEVLNAVIHALEEWNSVSDATASERSVSGVSEDKDDLKPVTQDMPIKSASDDRLSAKFADMDDFSDMEGFDYKHGSGPESEPAPVFEVEILPRPEPKELSLEEQIQALLKNRE